jgi:proline dehydrogenase
MSLIRSLLLRGSQSAWLRERAMRLPFVRRSVARFMPGERAEDALQAARALHDQGVGTIVTQLGENLSDAAEAERVTSHYLEVLQQIRDAGLDTQVSVKLTQLGLDLDKERCFENLMRLVKRAGACGNVLWIDMEDSSYVDRTLEQYRRARAQVSQVGVCLQAYLRRTPADLESLLPLGPSIRLVKGAYREPPEVAFPSKKDVDEAFYALATRFLTARERGKGAFLGIATHDRRLLRRLQDFIAGNGVPRADYECEMLYGIQRGLQKQVVSEGGRLRVLISYGEYWFPWYMRRLAERPANVLFVLRSVLSR